ncbi:MAG: hypothetical protein GX228_01450 [Firmicutes bacterium]|jgi:hypothetical protein|nr:hypothetical protein [Bacillota bacterium]
MMVEIFTEQHVLSVAAGKRLIAKAVCELPSVKQALAESVIVITAGTTNAYIADEILRSLRQGTGFSYQHFYRGYTVPSGYKTILEGEPEQFLGDVVLRAGQWERGLTIFDVADELKPGDVIVKGANAVNLQDREAAVLIGHLRAGTIGTAIQAVIGRRVELVIPVGLEKRVTGSIGAIANRLNAANASGPRYFPVRGNIITELEAIHVLSGVEAELVAGGGVSGAEGSSRIAVTGTAEQLQTARQIVESIVNEPPLML